MASCFELFQLRAPLQAEPRRQVRFLFRSRRLNQFGPRLCLSLPPSPKDEKAEAQN